MKEITRRSAKEGFGLGVIAGIIFAVMEIVGALIMGHPPLMPLRIFASVILGQSALEPSTPIGTAVLVGSVAHLVLSSLFGLVYGLVLVRASDETHLSWGRQGILGFVYGVALYVVNFQVIARIMYPWFLETPQLLQMAMHAMFFGLPLGLMYAGVERRVYRSTGRLASVAR